MFFNDLRLKTSAKTPFLKLSLDLISIIAEFLNTKDIKSARLSGRHLHYFLTPYLFRSVTFAPYQECLDRLKFIAQDPVISHHTKTLYFDCTVFRLPAEIDELDSKEFPPEYDSYSQSWILIPRILHETEDHDKRAKHEANYSLFTYTHKQTRDNLEAHLRHTFNLFPKIRTVILTNTMAVDVSGFKYALKTDTVSRLWIRPQQMLALIRAISISSRSTITRICTEGRLVERNWSTLGTEDFGDDSDMVGSVKYCIPDFDTGTYLEEVKPTVISSAFDLSPSSIEMCRSIFQNLTCLHLTLAPTQEGSWDWDIAYSDELVASILPRWVGFSKLLSSLVNIVDLALDFQIRRSIDQQHTAYYYQDDLKELFESPPLTFHCLKSLSLSRVGTCANSMKCLLERHGGLRELTLKHIIQIQTQHSHPDFYVQESAMDPEWIQILELMRSKRLRKLDLRDIEGFQKYWTLPGREFTNLLYPDILNYVLHGYGENPLVVSESQRDDWDNELWGEDSMYN